MNDLQNNFKQTIVCLHKFGTEILYKHSDFVLKWIIINYVFIKLKQALKRKFKYICLPDKYIYDCVKERSKELDYYVDCNACIITSSECIDSPDWFYIFSMASRKKYKAFILPAKEVPKNVVYLSELMLFNLNNHLGITTENYMYYFLIPTKVQTECAKNASVSLINSTQNYSNDLTTVLLENYFSFPRFLRKNDIFNIDIKQFAPEYFYTNEFPNLQTLYFKVNSIDDQCNSGKYIFKSETRLIQEGNINSYVSPESFYEVKSIDLLNFESNSLMKIHPPCLNECLHELETCVAPFLQNESKVNIRPIFLVQGSQGFGKFKLVKSVAKRKGFHFVCVNLSEVRTLTTAQKESKIRMVFQGAANCIPCVLMLRNIEVIALNTEGKKDERALATFSAELKNVYEKEMNLPLITIATTEAKTLPIELEINFIENISIKYMTKQQRHETLLWLLKTNGIKCNADIRAIAEQCSDFCLADLEILVRLAVKDRYKLLSKKSLSLTLSNDNFTHAYEHLQRMFSDQIGGPKIPKVYWQDVGGLVKLKDEIMRRIEMSMSPEGEKSGLLLYGPPGTGKTLLAKVVATEYHFHFLSVKGPELLNMYVGQSEENVRQIFEKARAAAPCVIFFDELDSLAPNRGRSGDSGGVMDRVVSQLLTEMDGIESNNQMIIIGATNRPDLIDPALLRPGRFDKMLYVGTYNDKESQISVLQALTRKFNLERNGCELDEIVELLPPNLTGADLYAICSDAWMAAVTNFIHDHKEGLENKEFQKDPVVVTLSEFKRALKEFKPSVSEKEMRRYIKLKNDLS